MASKCRSSRGGSCATTWPVRRTVDTRPLPSFLGAFTTAAAGFAAFARPLRTGAVARAFVGVVPLTRTDVAGVACRRTTSLGPALEPVDCDRVVLWFAGLAA